MIEIVVSVILQIATILGGVNPDKVAAEKKAQEIKAQSHQTSQSTTPPDGSTNVEGGTGNWYD
ncbi:hypothetical protein [Pontibacter burrus]|uniref:Uncharacterized protein n=1 Tax=Pontibacter burrus TaxID=2704466 RepID=A0A6B3LVH9_9BACT|nr:hypothetical protein [Pontibacter burrus]NEM97454.1 hypothetical protein [Pontibacter burrus]